MAFDEDASNLGVNLAETLNRHVNIGTAALRYQLTGATTLTFAADAMQEKFDLSPMRDSTSVRVAPGVGFDPRAIINGRAYVGYRASRSRAERPQSTGLVYAVRVDLGPSGCHAPRCAGEPRSRCSFDVTTPYYVMNRRQGDRRSKVCRPVGDERVRRAPESALPISRRLAGGFGERVVGVGRLRVYVRDRRDVFVQRPFAAGIRHRSRTASIRVESSWVRRRVSWRSSGMARSAIRRAARPSGRCHHEVGHASRSPPCSWSSWLSVRRRRGRRPTVAVRRMSSRSTRSTTPSLSGKFTVEEDGAFDR